MSNGILHINSIEAWDILSVDDNACLVDVRTKPEWQFVGVPNLDSVNKKPFFISWMEYPDMSVNPDFIDELKSSVQNNFNKIVFLCRSGGRSAQAAEYATNSGLKECYNISDGFEGDLEEESRHRSKISGWKYNNLPWEQT